MLSITLQILLLVLALDQEAGSTESSTSSDTPEQKMERLEAKREKLEQWGPPPLGNETYEALLLVNLNRCKLKKRGQRRSIAYKHPWLCRREIERLVSHVAAIERYYAGLAGRRAEEASPIASELSERSRRVEEKAEDAAKQALASAQQSLLDKLVEKRAAESAAIKDAQEAPDDKAKAKKAGEAKEEVEAALKAAEAVSPDLAAAPAAEKKKEPAEKSEAEKELDKLKAGKLIRYGITGGVGPAVYFPLYHAKDKASVPGAGAVTYVMFHPGYWRNAPAENIYCANRWEGTSTETAASRAADDAAKERAAPVVDSLLVAQKAGALATNEDVVAIACPNGNCRQSAPQIRSLAAAANGAAKEATEFRSALTDLVQRYTLGWTTGIAGKCGRRMVGIWAGYPLKYTTTVPYVDAKGINKRGRFDVTPLFAGGFGLSPNAYFSLLAGISVGRINLPPGGDNDDEAVVSVILGFGGNLDLFGLFAKGL